MALAAGATWGCEGPVVPPERDAAPPRDRSTDFGAASGYDPDWSAARSARKGPRPPASIRPKPPRPPTIGDPLRGRWSLKQATATLPPGDQLVATITTSAGELTCQLWPDQAPQAVALFIGLANGLRPWRTKRGWLRRPAFDGTRFVTVSDAALIELTQPPDAADLDIGLTLPPEARPAPSADRAGLLCLGAPQEGTPGLSVVITTGPTQALGTPPDGGPGRRFFSVFGQCGPPEAVQAIAAAPHHAKPKTRGPAEVQRVRVTRKTQRKERAQPGPPNRR